MEKLEKDQKVGESVSQAGQTSTATTTNAPKGNRSSSTTTTARPPPPGPARPARPYPEKRSTMASRKLPHNARRQSAK